MNNDQFLQDSDLNAIKKETILELQQDLLLYLLPVIFMCGLLFLIYTPVFQKTMISASTSLGLYVLVIFVWYTRKFNHHMAAWGVIAGIVSTIFILVPLTGSEVPIMLLALPCALAMLIISVPASLLVSIFCTLLIQFVLPANGQLFENISILLIWSSVGLVFLAWRALLSTSNWALSSYYGNRKLLEQARNNQLILGQTMSDLMDANLQLTRLNILAQNLQRAAEDAKIAKENFVASVSHELRTPLNMILGFGEMISKSSASYGRKLPTALLADLSVIVRNSQHLSSLIDDILDLSRIEAGQMSLSREDTSLKEIVEAAVAAVRPLYKLKNLSLETIINDDPTAFCDRTRIREVMINLLSNAGRFTEKGGVNIKVYREGNHIITSVSDTGPGISEENQKKLFQPFQQLDNSYRRRFGGTGLGLSISKNFIDLHDGKIWVESATGQGSTFFFSLPIDPPTMPENKAIRWLQIAYPIRERTRRSLVKPPSNFPRYVVLEMSHTLTRLISRYVVEVDLVSVSTIEDAIAELIKVPSQALLINMPSNQPMLGKIKEMALPVNTPIILCSLPDLTKGDPSMGVASYLMKPVTMDALLQAIEKLTDAPKTILIVDDEPEASRLYWRMLISTKKKYRILAAADGRQGLNILNEEKPDLVLLDMVMPEMDGFQFLAKKNQDPMVHDIPVIVLSARDPSGHPIVSDSITITQQGGLSTNQILSCIKMLNQLSGEDATTTRLESFEELPG